MAVPTIAPIQSVLGFPQWQVFFVQFTAIGSPTSWSITPTAPGLYFDTVNGTLFGAATEAGIYSFYVTATNGTGDSTPLLFTIRIIPSTNSLANTLDITIDVLTREVTMPSWVTANMMNLPGPNTSTQGDPQPTALFWAKYGDIILLNITFVKNGVIVTPLVTALSLTLMELAGNGVLVEASTFAQAGSGSTTSFILAATITGAALQAAISNYQGNYTDQFIALAEIEWEETNPVIPSVGPGTIISTSQIFGVCVPLELTPS
jgi:hypothetical protein